MWKPVYLIVGLMIGLLILVSSSSLSPTWEGLLQGLIVIVGLGLITLWLDTHPSAFISSSPKKSGFIVYEYRPVKAREAEGAEIFQPYSDSENNAPQPLMDHRHIRDLVKKRKEISKWSLN